MTDPVPSRPDMPGYGVPDAESGAGLFPWAHVRERMAAARNYWIGTCRPDGRPHAMPVWGVWLDDAFYFGTGRTSRKARNLAANPAIVVHLESGDDVVILEGTAEEMRDRGALAPVDEAYTAKYGLRLLSEELADAIIYRVRPTTAFAWFERDFPGTATRWRREG